MSDKNFKDSKEIKSTKVSDISRDIGYDPVPLKHTNVLYDPNDGASWYLAWISMLPVFILVHYVSWFIVDRDIEALICFCAQFGNDFVNRYLKKVFKEKRPTMLNEEQASEGNKLIGKGYGMPSSHSQFMGFYSTYYILRVIYKWNDVGLPMKLASITMFCSSCFIVCYSRFYLHYHSKKQIIVGILCGAVCGMAYFSILALLREVGFISWFIELPIIRDFYVKDEVHVAITIKDEYEIWKSNRAEFLASNFTREWNFSKLEL